MWRKHSCLPRRHSCRRSLPRARGSVELRLDAARRSACATTAVKLFLRCHLATAPDPKGVPRQQAVSRYVIVIPNVSTKLALNDVEVFGRGGENLAAGPGDHPGIFVAHAAEALAAGAWCAGNRQTGARPVATGFAEPGRFVDLQAEPRAGRVDERAVQAIAGEHAA